MSIKKFFRNTDLLLLGLVVTLALLGMLVISSATASFEVGARYVLVQGAAFLVGLGLIYGIAWVDYENLSSIWKWLLGVTFGLLVLVLILGMGEVETGTKRWIRFGNFGFQPSEVVKVFFIITLAKHISDARDDINYIKNVLLITAHALIPIVLIALQPDAGTALSFVFVFLVMLFVSGIDWRYLAYGAGIAVLMAPVLYFFLLHDYQRARILEFFNPGTAPTGQSYQVMQSKIAIGSGQIVGSGLYSGLQTQMGLLPAKHTDFIFGVVGEELGLIGCLVVISLLFGIIARCVILSRRVNSPLAQMMCIGVAATLAFGAIENILMTLGFAPVTGIPLPFMSYGGTSMVSCMAMIGIALSSSAKRRI